MARIEWLHDIEPAMVDLPALAAGTEWRLRRAEENRRILASRVRDDWLACLNRFHSGDLKTVGGTPVKTRAELRDAWTAGAERYFVPIFANTDVQYWLDHDRYDDLWHMAGLSRGRREDAALQAERLFGKAFR